MKSCAGFEETCQADIPLRDHSWYGLGGPARWFFMPRNDVELAAVLARCRDEGVPWRVLGRGANLLVRDEGFDGLVIRLAGAAYEYVRIAGTRVRAGAGVDFPRLVRTTVDLGLSGLEGLAGIPGSVGGIIRMNAGGRYGSIADFVVEVRLLDPSGRIVTRTAAEVGFAYRHTNLGGCVVLGVTLELAAGDPTEVNARYKEIWSEKAATQPALSERSAGCIFKNPPGHAAGALIDRAGLKGHRLGGAEISTRHANFIVAHPGATTADVLNLIEFAKDRVRHQTGVELELEVEIW